MNPIIYVVKEPLQRGYRFRYMCEGSAHGPIPSESSTKENKSYPTIRIDHCPPHAAIYLHVSLCTESKEDVHMHNLHGKHVFNGEYMEILKVNEQGSVIHSIQGISILQTKNQNKNEVLGCKLAQVELLSKNGIIEYKNMMTSWALPNSEFNSSCFRNSIPNMQDYFNQASLTTAANNVVRLKFRAFLVDFSGPLNPLISYSKPIFDCKVPATALLKIQRISRVSGSMDGGDEVFLICDKIERNDIEVVFYLENENGGRQLIGHGTFSPSDVYHQFIIVFKTPPCTYNAHTVDAKLSICRKKNPSDMSPSLDFRYISSNPPYMRRQDVLDPTFNMHLQDNFQVQYMQPPQEYAHPPFPQHPFSHPLSHDLGSIPQRPSEPMDSESNFSSTPSYNPHPSLQPSPQSSIYANPVSSVVPNILPPVHGDNPSIPPHAGIPYAHSLSTQSASPVPYPYNPHTHH